MALKSTFLFLFISSCLTLAAQTDCPCCTEAHQQFDFWVGKWVVKDSTGKKVGENEIVKLENGCILNEHWKGASGGTGRSYNYYNRADSTWNQVWIDNSGGNLVLKGKRQGNAMILRSELTPGKKVAFYRNQVTWTKNDDGSVRQFWEILDDKDKRLGVAFDGTYFKQ